MRCLVFLAAYLAAVTVAPAAARLVSATSTLENNGPLQGRSQCCSSSSTKTIEEPVTIDISIPEVWTGSVTFPKNLTLCNLGGLLEKLCPKPIIDNGEEVGIQFYGPISPSCFGGKTPDFTTSLHATFCNKDVKLKDRDGETDTADAALLSPRIANISGILLKETSTGRGNLTNLCIERPSVLGAELDFNDLLYSMNGGSSYQSISSLMEDWIGSSMQCWFNYLWELDNGYAFNYLVQGIVEKLVEHLNYDEIKSYMKCGTVVPEGIEYDKCKYTSGERKINCNRLINCMGWPWPWP